jgi:hypothetical protein
LGSFTFERENNNNNMLQFNTIPNNEGSVLRVSFKCSTWEAKYFSEFLAISKSN